VLRAREIKYFKKTGRELFHASFNFLASLKE
jgi:hypothetical protein